MERTTRRTLLKCLPLLLLANASCFVEKAETSVDKQTKRFKFVTRIDDNTLIRNSNPVMTIYYSNSKPQKSNDERVLKWEGEVYKTKWQIILDRVPTREKELLETDYFINGLEINIVAEKIKTIEISER